MSLFKNDDELKSYLANVYQLKNVIRYNTRNHLKDESVAEHSFYVALISLKICDTFNIDADTTRKCLTKALLHDMPEIELNDITHNVKEALNLRPFLKIYEDEYFKKHFKQHEELMTKPNDLIDSIVNLADAMSVYQFVMNEITLGNSSSDIVEIEDESKKRVDSLTKSMMTNIQKWRNNHE